MKRLWSSLIYFRAQAEPTHLQDTHAEGVSQDLVRLIVVTVADVGGSDEELERVVLIQVQCAGFDFLLQLPHALLSIAVRDNVNKIKPLLLSSLSGWLASYCQGGYKLTCWIQGPFCSTREQKAELWLQLWTACDAESPPGSRTEEKLITGTQQHVFCFFVFLNKACIWTGLDINVTEMQPKLVNRGAPDLFHDLRPPQTRSDAAGRPRSLSGHESGCLPSSGPSPSFHGCLEEVRKRTRTASWTHRSTY